MRKRSISQVHVESSVCTSYLPEMVQVGSMLSASEMKILQRKLADFDFPEGSMFTFHITQPHKGID